MRARRFRMERDEGSKASGNWWPQGELYEVGLNHEPFTNNTVPGQLTMETATLHLPYALHMPWI